MNSRIFQLLALTIQLFASSWIFAQQTTAASAETNANANVPNVINYSGVLTDLNDKPLTGIQGVTFLLYNSEQGGNPLWMETQNVTANKNGQYIVTLGSTTAQGLPSDIFSSAEARWLGIQVVGKTEQPRILLVAVPYAMKAADAATIGGLPPSAFVLAAPPTANSATSTTPALATFSDSSHATSDVTTSGGTVNSIPLFSTINNIQNSVLTQTSKAINVGGKLNAPATGTATASAGKDSQPHDFVASVFNSSTATAVPQTFQLQAEPVNNDTSTASGTLNLLYASGTSTPAETGFKIGSNGLITFATGQTFPGTGTGNGTITGVTAGTDLTGGGTSGKVTLNLNTANVPLLASANTFTANQTVKGTVTASNLTTSGTVSAATVNATNANLTGALSINATEENTINASSSSSGATTIYGLAGSSAGAAWGVEGLTNSTSANAYGVAGFADASSGDPIGVYGQTPDSPLATGVFGQALSESATGQVYGGLYGVGVWGDGGPGYTTSGSKFGVGVLGTVDNGTAAIFDNNSEEQYTLALEADNANGLLFQAFNSVTEKECIIDQYADLECQGTVSGIVKVESGTRQVALSAIQSPKNWFEDFGSAQLVRGVAVVTLDSEFMQTVNTEMDYKVFPVPDGDCKGLYVTNKTATSFEVRELGGGTSSVSFDYRIAALRRNFENVRFADRTQEMNRPKMQIRRSQNMQPHSHNPTKQLTPTPTKTASLAPAEFSAKSK
jgi:hypothetical protein